MRLHEIFETIDIRDLEAYARPYQGPVSTGSSSVKLPNKARGYNWKLVQDYPIARLRNHIYNGAYLKAPGAWEEFLDKEIEYYEGDPDYGRAADVWRRLPFEPIKKPIVVIDAFDRGMIWDGYHRVAACISSGRTTIPAVVGTPK